MKPVVQEEAIRCGGACAAAIAGINHQEARRIANGMGIFEDGSLWFDTKPVRRLLTEPDSFTGSEDAPFENWEFLADCALLSVKWHVEDETPFWRWMVFVRESGGMRYVLDSKKAL